VDLTKVWECYYLGICSLSTINLVSSLPC